MQLGESRGIKTNLWIANEEVTSPEFTNMEEVMYENITDLMAILGTVETATGSSANRVIGGLQVEWSSGLNIYLRAGAVVSYQGYYLQANVWAYNAIAGGVFSVTIAQDQLIACSSPASSNRIDILEIMPVQNNYNSKTVNFIDPVTKIVSSQAVNTRQSYDYAWQWKLGTPGISTAPLHDPGWIKIAEVTVPSSGIISQSNILDARDSDLWTSEASSTMYREQRASTSILEDRGSYFTSLSYKSVENALQYIAGLISTAATPNTLAKRDGSGNLNAVGLVASGNVAAVNATLSGTLTAAGGMSTDSGGNVHGQGVILAGLTSDPASPAIGQVWFRSNV